jgi:hypothetical protein
VEGGGGGHATPCSYSGLSASSTRNPVPCPATDGKSASKVAWSTPVPLGPPRDSSSVEAPLPVPRPAPPLARPEDISAVRPGSWSHAHRDTKRTVTGSCCGAPACNHMGSGIEERATQRF